MNNSTKLEKKIRQKLFKSVGIYLSEKRLKKGMTQEEIARMSGYSSQFISNIECGSAFPPAVLLTQMIKAYDIGQQEFLDTLMKYQLEYYKDVYFDRGRGSSEKTAKTAKSASGR